MSPTAQNLADAFEYLESRGYVFATTGDSICWIDVDWDALRRGELREFGLGPEDEERLRQKFRRSKAEYKDLQRLSNPAIAWKNLGDLHKLPRSLRDAIPRSSSDGSPKVHRLKNSLLR